MHTARPIGQPPRRHRPPGWGVRIPTICIVDPQPDGYQTWAAAHHAEAVQIELVPTAEAALRLAHTQTVDLWVVHVDLPGLSGPELCGMLKARASGTPVLLVADTYTPDGERAAWAARATSFTCKPGHHAWLDDWLKHAAGALP